MALPKIEAVITADTRQAEAGFDRVEKGMHGVGAAADRASARADNLGNTLQRTGARSAGFQRGIQNAAFQLGDFATQVGAGTSASIALGQQLPQLLGGFGILGAVLGAVVAVAVPLTRAFQGMSESGRDLSSVLGVLQPVAQSMANAFRSVAEMGVFMAEAIINNLDRILITAGTVAAFFAAKWVAAFVAARVATFSLAAALTTLRAALVRTGIGAIIVAAGELVYQFTRLVQAAGGFGEAIALLVDVGRESFKRIGRAGSGLWKVLKGVSKAIAGAFLVAFSQIAKGWDGLVNGMAKAWNAIAESGLGETLGMSPMDQSNVSGQIRGAGEALMSEGAADIRSGGADFDAAAAPLESVQKIRDTLKSIKDERITLPDLLGVSGGDEEGAGGGGGKSGGKSASEKLDEELSAQEERIRKHFDTIKALTEGGLSDKLGAWGNYFGELAALTGSNNEKLLRAQKSFAAAQALIDAWGAHNKVLNDPTLPWWARIASAAKVFAAGIGAVNAIKGVGASGNGSSAGASSGGGAGGAAAAAPAQVQERRVSEIRFMGSLGANGQQLVDLINDEYDRGNFVRAVVG